MPGLTPLAPGSETLTPLTGGAVDLVPATGGTVDLLPEEGDHPVASQFFPGLLPGPNTLPDDVICVGGTVLVGQHVCGEGDADTLPDDNLLIPGSGLALAALATGTETLTPLTED